MAADEKLVEELAEHLAERDGRRSLFTDDLDAIERAYRDEYRRTAQVALEWLAGRGRLVPEGASIEEQCGTRWRTEGGHEHWVVNDDCEQTLKHLGPGDEHAHRTVTTTPWVAVQPEPTQEEAPDA